VCGFSLFCVVQCVVEFSLFFILLFVIYYDIDIEYEDKIVKHHVEIISRYKRKNKPNFGSI